MKLVNKFDNLEVEVVPKFKALVRFPPPPFSTYMLPFKDSLVLNEGVHRFKPYEGTFKKKDPLLPAVLQGHTWQLRRCHSLSAVS